VAERQELPEEERLERLFSILSSMFENLPEGKSQHVKLKEGEVWIKRRPNGISLTHTVYPMRRAG
jgi:hypothetical protein